MKVKKKRFFSRRKLPKNTHLDLTLTGRNYFYFVLVLEEDAILHTFWNKIINLIRTFTVWSQRPCTNEEKNKASAQKLYALFRVPSNGQVRKLAPFNTSKKISPRIFTLFFWAEQHLKLTCKLWKLQKIQILKLIFQKSGIEVLLVNLNQALHFGWTLHLDLISIIDL